MFVAVLFTTAKIRKQPKCPSTGEWIKKISFLATKRTRCLPFATIWVDLEVMLTEISQRKTNIN